MGLQTIYVNAHGDTRLHQRGFSWFAAVLFPVWAVRNRLFGTAVGSAVFGGLIATLSAVSPLKDAPWIQMGSAAALLFTYGTVAPRWHAYLLRRAGYRVGAREPD